MGSGLLGPWVKAAAITLPLAIIAVPTAWLASGPPICLFRRVTGWPCPGCGMTRVVSTFLHGDVAEAMRFNRLVVVVFPVLCCVWAKYIFGQFRRIRADRPKVPRTTGA